MELLKDTKFKNGFGVMDVTNTSGYKVVKVLETGSLPAEQYSWLLAQWGTKFSFENIAPRYEKQTIVYENKGKKVAINTDNGEIYLLLTAENEYSEPRKMRDMWPHVLIEQVFEESIRVSPADCKTLTMSLDFNIDVMQNCMTSVDYDSDLHTAQISWYITLNANKEDNNDYMWFGLPIYDYRHDQKADYIAVDDGTETGTRKLIYSVGTEKTFGKPVQLCQRTKLKIDVLPFIKTAFAEGKARGCLQGLDFCDISIGSMNLGWEVTGTFNAGIKIHSISINYTK